MVLSIPLFTGGRLINEIKSAKLLAEASENRLSYNREELVFNLTSIFYNILAQRKVIESLEFSQRNMTEHLKQIEEFIAVNKAAPVDKLRIEVRIADLNQKLILAKNVLAIQNRVLVNLMGIKNTGAIMVEGNMETFPEDTQFSQKELIGTALKNRKDYRATQLNLQAQEKTVNAARAARWPTISLLGSYGTRWAVEPNVYPQGTHNMENVGRIGIALDLPVFDGKRIDAKIREEQAKLFAIKERLRKFEQQISLEIESAILNINSSRERIYALEKFIQQAEETLRIERLKYQLGKGAIIDVLDAQSALVEIQTNYYRALADYHVALSQLKLAIGEFL